MRNSQVAVLCGAILAGALIVAGTNVWLVRSLGVPAAAPARRPVIAMMPKAKGDPYFVSCRAGAEEAARELGVELIWDGPTGLDAARQNELVESWITRGVDVIAVAVENRASISTALRKAQERGIRVLTWDADAEPDARAFFVNQATAEGIGNALTDEAARLLGGKGEFAIITGALSAANQNEWIGFIKKRLADKYPNLKLATIRPSDDDRDKAFAETQTILRVFPNVKLVMAISAPAVPGAGEAVRQARRADVKVIGLSLPNMNKPYVHEGVVQTVMLWNTADLGYLAVYAGAPHGAAEARAGCAVDRRGPAGHDRDSRDRDHSGPAAVFQERQHRPVRFLSHEQARSVRLFSLTTKRTLAKRKVDPVCRPREAQSPEPRAQSPAAVRYPACRKKLLYSILLALLTLSVGAGFTNAQTQSPAPFVHVNGAIDKLKRGKSLAGAIMYDFSLYAARRFAESDLDFVILDMEHQALDFERMQAFFLGLTNRAEIARQGHVQQRVPPIVRIPTYGRDQNEFITKQVLDMGAMGIMFPAIETREQALHAVQLARYPQPRKSQVSGAKRTEGQRTAAGCMVLGPVGGGLRPPRRPVAAEPAGRHPAVPAGGDDRGRAQHQRDSVGARHRRAVHRAKRSVVFARRAARTSRS